MIVLSKEKLMGLGKCQKIVKNVRHSFLEPGRSLQMSTIE